MKVKDIDAILAKFVPNGHYDRYSSWDYCYNYFKSTSDLEKNIEKSCMELWSYLSSWGMLRASSYLFRKSPAFLKDTIVYINSLSDSIWVIDADCYSQENIKIILDVYEKLCETMKIEWHESKTLITKIMLGVFGMVPAYDNYFCKTFGGLYKRGGFSSFTKESLLNISNFYDDNKKEIDDVTSKTFTWNFGGTKSTIHYTNAKIIDMYGFSATGGKA